MLTCSLQSGSNGNCIYVEAGDVRLLFDAGISGRQTKVRLAAHGRELRGVHGLILSHGHTDHTRSTGAIHRLYQVPVYATPGTLHAIEPYAGRLHNVHTFSPGARLTFGAVTVFTLPTPHDARDSVAFVVQHEGKRLGVLTDLGHPFVTLARTLRELDAAYLESNYDPQMLAEGPYPPQLKARIRGQAGHLSNQEAAALLESCGARRPRWVALAHLSEENNRPDLALQTHREVLGADYPLTVASRHEQSEMWEV